MQNGHSVRRTSLIIGALLVLTLGADRMTGEARASGKDAKSIAKAPPPGVKPGTRKLIPECARRAYAKLAVDVAELRAKHSDAAAFTAAYAARKEELVGQNALAALGCGAAMEE